MVLNNELCPERGKRESDKDKDEIGDPESKSFHKPEAQTVALMLG